MIKIASALVRNRTLAESGITICSVSNGGIILWVLMKWVGEALTADQSTFINNGVYANLGYGSPAVFPLTGDGVLSVNLSPFGVWNWTHPNYSSLADAASVVSKLGAPGNLANVTGAFTGDLKIYATPDIDQLGPLATFQPVQVLVYYLELD